MLDALTPFAVPGGLTGLVLALAWMVFTDRLIPGRTHMRMLADRDKQIAKLEEALDKVSGQRDRLMGLADTTVKVLEALPRARDST